MGCVMGCSASAGLQSKGLEHLGWDVRALHVRKTWGSVRIRLLNFSKLCLDVRLHQTLIVWNPCGVKSSLMIGCSALSDFVWNLGDGVLGPCKLKL